jgi:2-polyprenyl-3-methyl-5-hydroxy-6-metoxy-1,4-benzoquinol methylase
LCDLDNSAGASARYSSDPWRIKCCDRCGFVYLENPPDYDQLRKEWAWEKTLKLERKRRRAAEPAFQRLARLSKWFRRHIKKRNKLGPLIRRYFSPGAVIDVGCGKGHWLRQMGEMGFIPSGVEISDGLAAQASPHAVAFGGRVARDNAVDGLDEFADGTFTGATLVSVLEHESHPMRLLAKLYRKLKANGIMIIKVPNFACWNRRIRGPRWCGFRFPEHVNYFTPDTLREMMQRAKFKVIRFCALDRFPLSDSMWMVCQAA